MVRKLTALLPLLLLPALLLSRPQQGSRPGPLVFTHVTVIDMTGAPAKPDMTLAITGDCITALGKTGKVRIPANARVVDASGKFLIPGLWDMHVHISETERSFPMFIANGVLGIRNMGGNMEKLFQWREEVASGKVLGPHIVACGPVVDGPQPSNPDHAIAVHDAAEGRQAVDTLKQRSADFIKVYDGIPRDAYFAIVDEAKKQNIPFVGHVPLSVTTIEASDAGQKSIEHLGKILDDSSTAEAELRRQEAEPIPPGDFSVFPRRLAARYELMLKSYSEQKANQIFAHLVRNHTWQVPTLTVKRVQTFIDDLASGDDARVKYIPSSEREWWSPKKGFFFRYRTPEYIAARKKVFRKEMELVGALHRANVPFMAGTDMGGAYTFPGFSLHDELALLVEAGFTPMETLETATRNPAEFLGELDSLGTVEKGKIANLVLLDANPLEDIRNTEKIAGVVLRGHLISKPELQAMLDKVETDANKK